MSLPAESRPTPVARWRGALPEEFVNGLAARPMAARAFERLSLSHIRSVVRWVQSGATEMDRRRRLRRVLAGLAPPITPLDHGSRKDSNIGTGGSPVHSLERST